jgi:hypothetical protein
MTLNSALEDLRWTTLKALMDGLQRLEYLSKLREPGGTYAHWGLARVHGELAASRALVQEHHMLVSRVLATPIARLFEDLERSSRLAGLTPEDYIKQLSARGASLLPPEPGAGAERHLNSVLHVLSCLTRTRLHGATHRAA